MPVEDRAWKAVGEFIRTQRNLANLSLRQLAAVARVSNPYLSQIERGVHRPSAEVLKAIADALQISAESLYSRVGLLEDRRDQAPSVDQAVRLDPRLSTHQKEALIRVYRSFIEAGDDKPAPSVAVRRSARRSPAKKPAKPRTRRA